VCSLYLALGLHTSVDLMDRYGGSVSQDETAAGGDGGAQDLDETEEDPAAHQAPPPEEPSDK